MYSPPRKDETTSGMYPVFADQTTRLERSFVLAEIIEDDVDQFCGQSSTAGM
jgi:hypothetical protein